ncbi:MAG: hypothetical protein V4490_04020 [Pseudomonadota bacterium]
MNLAEAYETRLKALQSALNQSQSDTFRALLASAVHLTQHALEQSDRLHKVTEESYGRDSAFLANKLRQSEERAALRRKELDEVSASLSSKFIDDTQRAVSELRLKAIQVQLSMDTSITNTEIFRIKMTSKYEAATSLITRLFKDILKPNESQFQLTATVEGIHVALSAVPLAGNIYSGLLGIYNISTSRKRFSKIADKQAIYLEEYVKALRVWFAATEAVIRALQSIDE